MGFLASFYGSQAQSHQQTTQDWKRLWQADEELAQRERQMKLEQEAEDRRIALAERQAYESVRQFNVSDEFRRLQLELQTEQFNAERADSIIKNIMPAFEEAGYLQQLAMAESMLEMSKENNYLTPTAEIMYSSVPTEGMTLEQARVVMSQVLDPWATTVNGTPLNVPEPMIQQALKVLGQTSEGATWQAAYDEMLADPDAFDLNKYHEEGLVISREQDIANLKHTQETTRFVAVQADTVDAQLPYVTEELEARIQGLKTANQISEVDLQNRELAYQYAEAFIQAELAGILADTKNTELGNEYQERTMDTLVDTLAEQLKLTKSEARVAVAIEQLRIDEASLTNDMMRATLDQIQHDMDMQDANFQQRLLEYGVAMIASGRTEVLESHGEILFGENWDDISEDILAAAEYEYSQNDLMRIVQIEESQARTQKLHEEAAMVAPLAQSHIAYQSAQSNAALMSAAQRGGSGTLVGMGSTEAHREVSLALGFTTGKVQEEITAARNMQVDLRALRTLYETEGADSPELLASLSGFLSEYGITPPANVMNGGWDSASVAQTIERLEGRVESQITAAENRAVSYLQEYLVNTGDMGANFAVMFGLRPAQTATGEVDFDSVDTRILRGVHSLTGMGNPDLHVTLDTLEEVGEIGADPEANERVVGAINGAIWTLTGDYLDGNFLNFEVAEYQYEDLLNDESLGSTLETRKLILSSMGITDPRSLNAAVVAAADAAAVQSAGVQAALQSPFIGTRMDISSFAGLTDAISALSEGYDQAVDALSYAETVADRMPIPLDAISEGLGFDASILIDRGLLKHSAGDRYTVDARVINMLESEQQNLLIGLREANALRTTVGRGMR